MKVKGQSPRRRAALVSTRELIARAPDERWAGTELVHRFARLVWWQVRRSGLDQSSAEDVVQTVWLRFWEHLDRIREPENVASWLTTTARREANRMRTSRLRQPGPAPAPETVSDEGRPEEHVLALAEREELRRALGRLDDDSRTFLLAITGDSGLDYRSLATRLNRPIGSLGPTRRRCLDKLERALAAS